MQLRRSSPSLKVKTETLTRAGQRICDELGKLVTSNNLDIARSLTVETSKFEVDGRKVNGLALQYKGQQERTALLAFRTPGSGLNTAHLPVRVLSYATSAPREEDRRETIPVTAEAARALAAGTEVTFSTSRIQSASGSTRDVDVEVKLSKLANDKISVRLSFCSSPPGSPEPLELGNRGELLRGLWHEVCALTQVNPRQTDVKESFIFDLSEERGAKAFESIFEKIPEPVHVDLAQLDQANLASSYRMFGSEAIPVTAEAARALARGTEVTFYALGILDARELKSKRHSWTQRNGDLAVKLHRLSHSVLSVSISFGSSALAAEEPLERPNRRSGGVWEEETFLLNLSDERAAEAYQSIFGSTSGPLRVDLAKLEEASLSYADRLRFYR